MTTIASAINGPDGFLPIQLRGHELMMVRRMISDAYLSRIQFEHPSLVKEFSIKPITEYHHQFAKRFFYENIHGKLFPKTVRVLPPSTVDDIESFDFMAAIAANFNPCYIRDEERFGWPNITWRLVRPNCGDVGPMHADQWFADIDGFKDPPGFKPIKVWIQIYGSDKSGLLVVLGSHLTPNDYTVFERDGRKKPKWNGDESKVRTVIPPCNPGQGIIFNHNLLHRGIENTSDQTRVSIDFTVYVPEDKLQ